MPGPISLTQECCAPECDAPASIQVPGPAGAAGISGTNGTNGISPSVLTTAQFLMPAEGANVTVAVTDNAGIAVGGKMFVTTAGTMQVISKTGTQVVTLQNLENTASGLYTDNAAPTTAIPSGSLMMPTGAQGAAGTLSGAAGGALKNNFPNPALSQANTKGTLIVGDGTNAQELSIGADATVLHVRSAQALGQQWSGIDLAGILTSLLNALPFSKGGTGQITQQAAMNALAATTTRGQLLYRNAAGNVVPLNLGAAGTVLLTIAGLDPGWSKITFANIDSTFPVGVRRTTLVAGQVINLNGAAGSDTLLTQTSAPTRYIIREIVFESASVNLAASAVRIGVYTNTAKGGTPIVLDPSSELTALTSANIWEALLLTAVPANTVMTSSTLYLHLSAAHGSAATAKIWIFADDIS